MIKRRIKRVYKEVLNKYFLWKIHKSPWMSVLYDVQEGIEKLSPHPYYVSDYRKAELYCWSHIPQWIYETRSTRKISRVLDIGCAYGTLALFCKKIFPDCKIYCTDFTPRFISKPLIKKYEFLFKVNNIELDPFPWELTFDIIIFTEVLEHLNYHPLTTLKKMHKLLSKKGRLYISTPDASEWGRVTKYYSHLDHIPAPKLGMSVIDDHVYQYTKEELISLIDRSGYRIEKLAYASGVVDRHFNLSLKK